VQNLFVEFVAASSASAGIVNILSAHRKPLPLMAIVREVSIEQDGPRKRHVLATSIAWAVLSILLVPCLTRVGRRGFAMAKVSREVERRIDSAPSVALADGHGPTLSPLRHKTKTLSYDAAL
jgi:hypothetical protein